MPDIKTRDVVKGTVKTIDKSATAAQRMKDAYIRTKRRAENSVCFAEDSPSEYAADRVSEGTETVLYETGHQLHRQGKKAVSSAKENISQAKSHFQRERMVDPLKKQYNSHSPRPKKGAVKTMDSSQKSVKQASKGTSKVARRTVKTAEKTAKTTIKTSQQAAKATQRTTQAAARASHRAAQAARVAAKATVTALKAAVRATISAVKAIIAATKALISALAAGGWVAVVVVIVICLIGLIVGSCFGIFFSGEDTGTGQSMRTAVREINQDYEQKLEEIKSGTRHDVLEMSGSRAVWPEVLAVYAVKTTTDPDSGQEVASMDDSKLALLKDIFWQMNEISSRSETATDTVVTETDDGDGHIIKTTTTTNRTTLYIQVSHKTADEMADFFHFNADQRKQLAELLADENRSMWSAVLYGIGTGDGEIVTVALSQLGNVGGQPYWSWYGFGSRVEWCACFVSWCANECGYIDAGVIPKFAGCGTGVQWFKDRGLWQDRDYEPRPGDIIFFDWNDENGQDGDSDHVGIVEKVENGVVYTVEGNSGDMCQENRYTIKVAGIFTNTKEQDSIGIAPSCDLLDNIVFADLATASCLLYGTEGSTNVQYGDFYVDDPDELERIMAEVQELPGVDWQSCTLTRYDNDYQNAKESLQGLQNIVFIAIAVVSVICFMVLDLFLTLRLRGRVHETGVYLAIGISKGSVLMQYLLEVILAAAVALPLSYGVSSAISNQIGSSLLSQVTTETYETVDLTEGNENAENPAADLGLSEINVTVSARDFLTVCAFGMALCIASTALAAYPAMKMKPKSILSQMS